MCHPLPRMADLGTPKTIDHSHPAKQTWQSAEQAALYRKSRDPSKFKRHHLEEKIINGWLDAVPKNGLVLDIPCGAGRLVPTITQRGFRYLGADFSVAMINEARQDAAKANNQVMGFFRGDAEFLPLADDSVDCVVIWRLFHHLGGSQIREAMLKEAARVSRDRVLISFHHALSFTAVRKFIQRTVFGRKQHGRPVTHWRLGREARRSGLNLLATKRFWKYQPINGFAGFGKKA